MGARWSPRGGPGGAHPEKQQRPRHHGADEEDDALGGDDVVLRTLPHVQEGPGERLCEEGIRLRAPPCPWPRPRPRPPARPETVEAAPARRDPGCPRCRQARAPSRLPGGWTGWTLTSHSEVRPAGALYLLALGDLAPIHAPVTLVHLLDDQLPFGTQGPGIHHWGPRGVDLEDVPPRDVGVAAAVVRALEAHLLPHAHRHRGWARLHPQGPAPGACRQEAVGQGRPLRTPPERGPWQLCMCVGGGVWRSVSDTPGAGGGWEVPPLAPPEPPPPSPPCSVLLPPLSSLALE